VQFLLRSGSLTSNNCYNIAPRTIDGNNLTPEIVSQIMSLKVDVRAYKGVENSDYILKNAG